jgi:hypothetical protein
MSETLRAAGEYDAFAGTLPTEQVVAVTDLCQAALLLNLVRDRAVAIGLAVVNLSIHFGSDGARVESVRVDFRRAPGGVVRWAVFDVDEGTARLLEMRDVLIALIDRELKARPS